MKTCFPGSIFSTTSDPAIAAATYISIGMWLDSKTDKLLVPNSPPHSVITPLRCSALPFRHMDPPNFASTSERYTHKGRYPEVFGVLGKISPQTYPMSIHESNQFPEKGETSERMTKGENHSVPMHYLLSLSPILEVK